MIELKQLVEQGHEIGNLGYNENHENYPFLWIHNTIKKISNQKNKYCFVKEKEKDILENCSNYQHYTIYPEIQIQDHFYKNVKKELKAGSLLTFSINEELKKNLDVILNYILSKGYQIETLEKHLEE